MPVEDRLDHSKDTTPAVRIVDSSVDWTPRYLDMVAAMFVATVLISNVAAQKLFVLGPAVLTAGIVVFPISYILGDVLTEVYGFARARRVIYMGLLANVFMALVLWVTIRLEPAPGWPLQDQFAAILGFVPRIVLASVVAFAFGELINAAVLSRMKRRMRGKHFWVRAISSTVIGELVDTAVFASIAFWGVMPARTLGAAILSAWLFKVGYETVATPLTSLVVRRLKVLEGVDHYDREGSLSVLPDWSLRG